MKLPLTFKGFWDSVRNTYTQYEVVDSEGEEVIKYDRWEDGTHIYDTDELQQMIHHTNNFPEAIRLLKEGLNQLESWNSESEDTFTIRRIKEFLTKLEEDEKNIK